MPLLKEEQYRICIVHMRDGVPLRNSALGVFWRNQAMMWMWHDVLLGPEVL